MKVNSFGGLFFRVIIVGLTTIWTLWANTMHAQEVAVLSYNIHHCNPPSKPGKIEVEAIAQVILDSGADLVALQEVDVYTVRSGTALHQAKKLGELTGMHWFFYKSIDHAGGEYGNALLSRFPIIDRGGFSLPNDPDTEPRTAIFIDVKLPGGQEITFAGTHLEFKREAVTLRQAEALVSFFDERPPKPIILAGDFNAEASKSPIGYLDRHFSRSCKEGCSPTSPQINPNKEIDFIMVKPPRAFQIASHRVIEETYASDHLPVLVNLQVNK
ncbi:endonuclease/exonuclease/phosphatase family protein [Lunatimonas salinarum]|uniref:endonuclease/exonuclease/phosphatase family protein n=1 Tax=Lunatimonas salinarum TaxID=1774590 RepID=UPI001FD763C0|nr:endonuclease/exonuclease/phosphatase family protein [Lunatimonas salinarum]